MSRGQRLLFYLLASIVIGAVLVIVTVGLIAFLVGPAAAANDDYADAVRAAALAKRLHLERCRQTPEPTACRARAEAEWTRAMVLADARRVGTKAAWDAAQRELARIDARGEK